MSLTTFPRSWVERRRFSALLLVILSQIVTFTTTFASPAGTWRQLSFESGATPGPRSDAGVIYDGYRGRPGDRERLILFGGTDGVPHNDIWSFDFRSEEGWQLINPLRARRCLLHASAATFVSRSGPEAGIVQASLTGGQNAAGSIFFDKWNLSLDKDHYSWQSCSGFPEPTPRIYAASTFTDNTAFRPVVIVGGTNGIVYWDDTWKGVRPRASSSAPAIRRQTLHASVTRF
jgi:hypothetical protein